MKNDIKHTINLVPAEGAQQRACKIAEKMEADARLSENAKIRMGDVKMEKWWSVAAGMALIAAFILYTCYLTIPAVVLFCLLGAFLIYVFIHLRSQRKRVEEAEPEISPNRSVYTFVKKALGQDINGRDVSEFMDGADVAAFGSALRARLAGLGLDTANVSVRADVKVTEADKVADKCGKMPVRVVLDCAGVKAELKWDGMFAMANTGDCMIDTKIDFE